MKIIFICHGNTCRSPMAEGFAVDFLKKSGKEVFVKSAGIGISAMKNLPPTNLANLEMKRRGIDISNIRSKHISEIKEVFDYVISMEEAIGVEVENNFPKLGRNYIFWQIADPYAYRIDKTGEIIYSKTADEISRNFLSFLERNKLIE